jgi:hypothetical protein
MLTISILANTSAIGSMLMTEEEAREILAGYFAGEIEAEKALDFLLAAEYARGHSDGHLDGWNDALEEGK